MVLSMIYLRENLLGECVYGLFRITGVFYLPVTFSCVHPLPHCTKKKLILNLGSDRSCQLYFFFVLMQFPSP